jgi:hypothetical protein
MGIIKGGIGWNQPETRHPYTGVCKDCRCFVKRPLLICFGCLVKRQEQLKGGK